MSRRDEPPPKPDAAQDRAKQLAGESTFAWDFGGESHAPTTPVQGRRGDAPSAGARPSAKPVARSAGASTQARRPPTGAAARRVAAVQELLDVALTRWWAAGELPPSGLLQEALQLLEAGHPVGEAQRTLLLRTALAYGRGVVTALKHQHDDERTILLLHEGLTAWQSPLRATFLTTAARAAEQTWYRGLIAALQHTSEADPDPWKRASAVSALREMGERNGLLDTGEAARGVRRDKVWLRRGLLATLVILIVGFFWQQGITAPADMAAVPAGTYAQRAAGDGGMVLVNTAIDAFLIDRFEVTNDDFRRCMDAGICPPPAGYASATQPNYFTDPAFHEFPVVYVTYAHAETYCDWRGKRLPSAVEWQVAAGDGAGATALTYPWGESYAPQWANGAGSGVGDTLAVGAYRPAGDSWLGVSDLAGNVAEWTSTAGESAGLRLVKGGSFRSDPQALTVHAEEQIAAETVAELLGFRCAASRVSGRW